MDHAIVHSYRHYPISINSKDNKDRIPYMSRIVLLSKFVDSYTAYRKEIVQLNTEAIVKFVNKHIERVETINRELQDQL